MLSQPSRLIAPCVVHPEAHRGGGLRPR